MDGANEIPSSLMSGQFIRKPQSWITDKIGIHDKVLHVMWWVLAATVFGLIVAIRIRMLGIPLERDEGEYAYSGQLMLQGIPPYKLAYNMKFPGTYAAYAVMMSVFGQTIAGVHLGLLLVNACTIALVFFLGRQLVNWIAGIAAAASYAVLSVSPSVLGFAAHATHFIMLPVLGALLLLNQPNRQSLGRLFGSGLLLGIGLLMKQPASSFILFGASYLVVRDIRAGFDAKKIFLRGLVFGAGVILPFAITCFVLWHAGVFQKFWLWTIDYARQYGSLVPSSAATQIFIYNLKEVIGSGWALWGLAGIGLIAGLWDKRPRTSTGFLLGLLVFSALALSPGFYFRQHYFIMVLPAVSLLVGVAINSVSNVLTGHLHFLRPGALLLFAAALSLPIFEQKKFFFEVSPMEACRMVYVESQFPETVRVAEYVREHTSPNDTVAVLGSEPQIYFYSHRHSATGYIYTYGLMEPQKYAHEMQREMIREIELARPKYLISVVTNDSWLKQTGSEQLIFNWATEYTAQNYAVVGFVNIMAPGRTDYYFGDIPQSVPRLGDYILIYERKP
jgi:hypothetical protein